ncbi:cytochrome P450 4d1-like isoform X2 [Cylas formicarius]|uniref:cytochrome P450 4d1-like isoform X2 n=1 Tax=Cylas formicarius TaxID=197179 RepID=UPI0029583CC2|nr:cytochrome P450 4d1-like isoform X2 [Cylas formicarius]
MCFIFNPTFWLIVVLAALCVHFYKIYTHVNYIPAPPYLPLLGHYFDYADETKILDRVSSHVYKYGGIIRQTNGRYTIKATFYRFLHPWLGEGLLTSEGEKWKTRRRALTPCFMQTSVLKSFLDTFEEKSDTLVKIFEAHLNEEISLVPFVKRFTLDVICATAMGAEQNIQENVDSKYLHSVETLCEIYTLRMRSVFKRFDWIYYFTEDRRKEVEALTIVNDLLNEIIQKKTVVRQKNDDSNRRMDMLHLLMRMKIDGKPLSFHDMREELNTFLFAGFDTTASALSFAVYEIAANPNVQNKIFEEQKKIWKGNMCNPVLTYESINEMVYLDLVVKEVLRLYPSVPFIGKRFVKDIYYGDIRLPRMLNFSVFIYALHRHPDYFTEPEKFIPERFENKELTDPRIYAPFGVKPRSCIGQRFAILELKSVLSKLIRNFEFVNVPGHKLVLTSRLNIKSQTGIHVILKRRKK